MNVECFGEKIFKIFTEVNRLYMQKILCLATSDTNRTFDKIVTSLKRKGSDVTIATWDRTGKKRSSVIQEGITYFYIMRGWGFKNWKLLIGKPLWFVRLFVYLLAQHPDLLWAANFESALPAVLAARFTHVPIIYYIHDNISTSYPLPAWFRSILDAIDYWVMRHSAAVIVPDENRIPCFADPIRYKFNIFTNTPSADAAPPLRIIEDQPFTIYATGSIEMGRGIKTLLSACERFPECRVLIAGRAPEKQIREYIQSSRALIDFRGEVSYRDALDLYNEADIVFAFYDPSLPVYRMASPTKLYEAMMMAKPVVVNEEAMISSKVREWNIGYSCAYHDDQALEQLLRCISQDRSDVAAKGKRALELFCKTFDWRLIETNLWQVVDSVINSDHC